LTKAKIISYKYNVGIHCFFIFPAHEISIVPGQAPNVLGEERIWCEVDNLVGDSLYLNQQLRDNFRSMVSKTSPTIKYFISTKFGEDPLLLA
jgi:hypothetical protein